MSFGQNQDAREERHTDPPPNQFFRAEKPHACRGLKICASRFVDKRETVIDRINVNARDGPHAQPSHKTHVIWHTRLSSGTVPVESLGLREQKNWSLLPPLGVPWVLDLLNLEHVADVLVEGKES